MSPLVKREWQEVRDAVLFAGAGVVFFAFTARILDEVIGVTLAGFLLAVTLGNASTYAERTPGVREFLLTRPVRRRRLLGAKLAVTLGILNGTLLFLVLCILTDLPAHFYGLFTETTLGVRIIENDAPVFYPAAIAFANAVLLLVLLLRARGRSPAAGNAIVVVGLLATGFLTARCLTAWPGSFLAVAAGTALLFLGMSAFLLLALVRAYDRLEITGGGRA